MSVYFQGRLLIQPQASGYVDTSALANLSVGGANILAILGSSQGGQPKTPIVFTDPSVAASVLIGGELLDAIERAFDASTQVNGASVIYAVRVDGATQAAATLADYATAVSINLSSRDYGIYTNRIRIQIQNESTSRPNSLQGKLVSVTLDSNLISQDNVYRSMISIQYIGAGSAATMTINTISGKPTLQTSITGASDGLNIDLTQYPTVQALVNYMAIFPAYTVSVPSSNPGATIYRPQDMDYLLATDIKTNPYMTTANRQAVIDYLNGTAQQWVSATAGASQYAPVNTTGWLNLTGAIDNSTGSPTTTDWQNAFDALKVQTVNFVYPVSSNSAIFAMGDAHCQYMSGTGKKPRRQIIGHASGLTVAQVIALQAAINSPRTLLVTPGMQLYDRNGNLTLFPSYASSAAEVAGMFAGAPAGTPMTHKFLNCVKLETAYQDADLNNFLQNGVCPLQTIQGKGTWVVQSISTWSGDQNFYNREFSTGIAVDKVITDLLAALDENIIGQPATPTLLASTVSLCKTILDQEVADGLLVGIPGDPTNPPYKNIVASIVGDHMNISIQVSPVIPNNYALLTLHAVPFSGSVQVAVA